MPWSFSFSPSILPTASVNRTTFHAHAWCPKQPLLTAGVCWRYRATPPPREDCRYGSRRSTEAILQPATVHAPTPRSRSASTASRARVLTIPLGRRLGDPGAKRRGPQAARKVRINSHQHSSTRANAQTLTAHAQPPLQTPTGSNADPPSRRCSEGAGPGASPLRLAGRSPASSPVGPWPPPAARRAPRRSHYKKILVGRASLACADTVDCQGKARLRWAGWSCGW